MSRLKQGGLRLLVLDGGDIRCLSQLDIVDELLHRVQWKAKLERERPLLACEYFDIIGAVGPAGFIAVLLFVFRLSIQDAKDEFVKLWKFVYAEDHYTPTMRSTKLSEALSDLFRRRNIPEDRKLLNATVNGSCKGFLCAISPGAPSVCRKFRTYDAGERGTDITILDAIRASCSSLGYFDPVRVGWTEQEETFIGGESSFNNPIREGIKELQTIYGPDREASCLLSLGYGRSSLIQAHSIYDLDSNRMSMMATMQSDALADEIEAQLGHYDVYYRFSVDRGLDSPGAISLDNLGAISTHTRAYLQQAKIQRDIESCVLASEKRSGVTVADITGSRSHSYTYSNLEYGQKKLSAIMHGLPPLSPSFVTRPGLMEAMSRHLFDAKQNPNRIVVLAGLGGSGKTQLVSKFARRHSDSFKHVLFIDASDFESIESGIISAVRHICPTCNSVKEALAFLVDPSKHLEGPWLLALDSGNDPKINFEPFLPICGHGYILITTRNRALSALSPKAYIEVDVMSEKEAVESLLKIIYPSIWEASEADYAEARAIVKALGYLPVAINQAGSYISQRHCLEKYLIYFRRNRRNLLSTTSKAQPNKHYHGIYAALDVTLPALSGRCKDLLALLACFNPTGFPLPLIEKAARYRFRYEPCDLTPRPQEFDATISLLSDLFCPSGDWNERELDDILLELEQYSLAVRVKVYGVWTLRFHPLVHNWMYDHILGQNQKEYQEAAFRLLICGTAETDEELYEFTLPHLSHLSSACSNAHPNDLAGIARLARWLKKNHRDLQLWKRIYCRVSQEHGLRHLRTTKAQVELALAYVLSGERDSVMKAQELMEDAVHYLASVLPSSHPDLLGAIFLRSQIYDTLGPYGLGVPSLQRDVVQFGRERMELAYVIPKDKWARSPELWHEAKKLFTDLPQARGLLPGLYQEMTTKSKPTSTNPHFLHLDNRISHRDTTTDTRARDIRSTEDCFIKVIGVREGLRGKSHDETLACKATLARFYENNGRYEDAEILRKLLVDEWTKRSGPNAWPTIRSREALARLYHRLERHQEAVDQWKKILSIYMIKSPANIWVLYIRRHLAEGCLRLTDSAGVQVQLREFFGQDGGKIPDKNTYAWILASTQMLFAAELERQGKLSAAIIQLKDILKATEKGIGADQWRHLLVKQELTKKTFNVAQSSGLAPSVEDRPISRISYNTTGTISQETTWGTFNMQDFEAPRSHTSSPVSSHVPSEGSSKISSLFTAIDSIGLKNYPPMLPRNISREPPPTRIASPPAIMRHLTPLRRVPLRSPQPFRPRSASPPSSSSQSGRNTLSIMRAVPFSPPPPHPADNAPISGPSLPLYRRLQRDIPRPPRTAPLPPSSPPPREMRASPRPFSPGLSLHQSFLAPNRFASPAPGQTRTLRRRVVDDVD